MLKPVGQPYSGKTIDLRTDQVVETAIEPASEDEIRDTTKVMGGEDWARRAEGLLRRLGRRAPTRRAGALREGLTPREVEVLGLVADGLSNRAVAERLVISEATAARHVFNLFGKLGVHTRAQAARIYAERGLGDRR